jgi:predicted ester cyclase
MMLRRAFPDVHIELDDFVADENRVAVRLTLQGTHTGEFLGFAPTGRQVKYVSHEFYRVADGVFAEDWVCSDTATLFQQLTETPPP